MRELFDAELDIVGGGNDKPSRTPELVVTNVFEEIIVDILKILEPKQPIGLRNTNAG